VKAASDIPAPVAGEIVAINPAVADAPEQLNRKPYEAWLFRMRPADAAATATLLDAAAYSKAVTNGG
jgi:glycine cleavage system H protein